HGLLTGGVDLIIIETMFDLLTVKAAMNGARRAMRSLGVEVPLQVQVTMELTGRMLPGTEIAALTVRRSNMVSMMMRSTPPVSRPWLCSS
ncbi:MAG: hypothetical protein EBX39_10595, partial [Actinobacteria bacterium]|nr:hypothetical protein [Actinomycetota bacterium]